MRGLAALPYTGCMAGLLMGTKIVARCGVLYPLAVLARGSNQFVANLFFDGIEIMRGQWLVFGIVVPVVCGTSKACKP